MRDDFPSAVKELLAKRVGHRCSNPKCRIPTSGPQSDPMRAINVGVASHVTAASLNGPRYDSSLTQEERTSPENGIWLCQKCGKLIDNDANRYPITLLREWKQDAENAAIRELEGTTGLQESLVEHNKRAAVFTKLEKMMPELLAKMRKDLKKFPFRREFVVLEKSWSYWPRGHELAYFFDDHEELMGKLQILRGHGLISEITYNRVKRFLFSEEFVDYLCQE